MREKLTKFEKAAEAGASPLLCSFGGGGGGGTQQTIQKTEPWEGQKPYLQDVYAKAQALYKRPGPAYFPGSTVARYDPFRSAGDEMAIDAALQAAGIHAATQGGLGALLGAADVLNNPFFGSALQATLDPVARTYREQILPAIDNEAYLSGAYSNTRLPLVKAQAADAANRAMADAAVQFGSQAYGQGLNALAQGVGMAPSLMQAAFYPPAQIQQIGLARQAQAQAELDDLVKRFQYYEQLPYSKLAEYANTVAGSSPGGTTFSQTTGNMGGNTGLATMLMLLPFLF